MAVMASRMLSRADLDALPDDGLRHELIDGAFVMTPAPGMAHQDFAFASGKKLRTATEGADPKVLTDRRHAQVTRARDHRHGRGERRCARSS